MSKRDLNLKISNIVYGGPYNFECPRCGSSYFGTYGDKRFCHDEFANACSWNGKPEDAVENIYDNEFNAFNALKFYTEEFTIVKSKGCEFIYRVDIGEISVWNDDLAHAICDCIIEHYEKSISSR